MPMVQDSTLAIGHTHTGCMKSVAGAHLRLLSIYTGFLKYDNSQDNVWQDIGFARDQLQNSQSTAVVGLGMNEK